jgi:hypothetical protein
MIEVILLLTAFGVSVFLLDVVTGIALAKFLFVSHG